MQLRALQNKYVAAVRQATSDNSVKHPTTAMFRSEDVLRPFLWAANYPDVSSTILAIVLNAIQLLLDGDAVSSGDIIHVLRILSIHAHGCTHSLNHAAGATAVPHSVVAVPTSVQTNTGIGSAIFSSVSGMIMGSAMGRDSKATANSAAHAAAGGLGLSVHGSGYSSSTGHAGHHHIARSWREDEGIALRILQLLLRMVDSKGYELTEDSFTAAIHVAIILLATDAVLPAETTSTGGKGGKANTATPTAEASSTSTGPIHSAKIVRRAAAAALRQMVSTLFRKAAASYESSTISTSSSTSTTSTSELQIMSDDSEDTWTLQKQKANSMLMLDTAARHNLLLLAFRTLHDVITLAFSNSAADGEQDMVGSVSQTHSATRPGPLAQALSGFFGHKLHPPPPSACMDLLVMILRQRIDLFTTPTPVQVSLETSTIGENLQQVPDFATLLRHELCPKIIHHLKKDHILLNTLDKRGLESMAPFSSFLWLIKIIATIIELYGYANHAQAVDDAIVQSDGSNSTTTMENESRNLLSCLTQFVIEACDKIRDTGVFEVCFLITFAFFSLVMA